MRWLRLPYVLTCFVRAPNMMMVAKTQKVAAPTYISEGAEKVEGKMERKVGIGGKAICCRVAVGSISRRNTRPTNETRQITWARRDISFPRSRTRRDETCHLPPTCALLADDGQTRALCVSD